MKVRGNAKHERRNAGSCINAGTGEELVSGCVPKDDHAKAQGRRTIARLTRQLDQLREQNQSLLHQLRATPTFPISQPPALPDDPPLRRHGYGPRPISLAVNLAHVLV